MTDPFSLLLAALALAIALFAGWFLQPRTPDLDGERWLKTMLATLLRGQVDREGGDGLAWEAAVLRHVPYHPAGRLPERKIADPARFVPPGLYLPGERALVETLAGIGTPEARREWMYEKDEAGIEARLGDPDGLGTLYDPARLLGPGAGWDDVARWGAGDAGGLPERLRRSLLARWVLVQGTLSPPGVPELLPVLGEVLGESALPVAFSGGEPEAAARGLRAALEGAIHSRSDRIVVMCTAEAAHVVLRALVHAPGIRDQLLAVVSVGGILGGIPGDEGPYGERSMGAWMEKWFAHAELDNESRRKTAYIGLQWFSPGVDPFGMPGLPVAGARFPAPAGEPPQNETVEPIDLGPLPARDGLPLKQVARALWLFVTVWLASRR